MTSLVRMDASKAGSARSGSPSGFTMADPTCSLTWAEAETMDILEDEDMMASIAEGKEDVKAGRLIAWTPRSAENTPST